MPRINLSLIIITKNSAATLEKTLKSVKDTADEIILVDDQSTDATLSIAQKYQAEVFNFPGSFGTRKNFALRKARGKWILNLDADEILSAGLQKEIRAAIQSKTIVGYYLLYQNYCFGHPLRYGGESYQMLRLFRRDAVVIADKLIHERFVLKSESLTGKLFHKINHYSYRSILQIWLKFTKYAYLAAAKKTQQQEKASLKKIFIYPLHMFWARFIKDQGYRDGLIRLPLDLGFAYMEFLTYFLMLFKPQI